MTLIMAFITPSNYLLTAWVSPSPALAGRLQVPDDREYPVFNVVASVVGAQCILEINKRRDEYDKETGVWSHGLRL